jgi:hypothetical protein
VVPGLEPWISGGALATGSSPEKQFGGIVAELPLLHLNCRVLRHPEDLTPLPVPLNASVAMTITVSAVIISTEAATINARVWDMPFLFMD